MNIYYRCIKLACQRSIYQRCFSTTPIKFLTNEPKYEVYNIDSCMTNPSVPEPNIVIIGAGIAGLSAAQRLIQCGIRNFIILEATDRSGGRIQSCLLADVLVELGAQYIEGGCTANPIFSLACQEGLLTPPLVRSEPYQGLFCTSDGKTIDLPVSITAYHTFKHIESEASTLFTLGRSTRSHGSLLQFLRTRIRQAVHNFPKNQQFDAARVMYGMINAIRNRCGDDLALVSVNHFGNYNSIPGGNVSLPLGYVGVITSLLRDLPTDCICYSKPVTQIRWAATASIGPRALVNCADGDEILADYVIVTVSLGVLKQQMTTLFYPALPREKVDAIEKIGYGNVAKVFLDYARPFWGWWEGGIHFARSPDELANHDGWTKGLSSVQEVEGSTHVLCALISGQEATQMELCSDEDVAQGITHVLRKFTGEASVPYPRSIMRSKWGTNPFYWGAYSYMAINTKTEHQCILAAPLETISDLVLPIVLFAGEATCSGHYSTVHGARLSGIREADRIVHLTKMLSGRPQSS